MVTGTKEIETLTIRHTFSRTHIEDDCDLVLKMGGTRNMLSGVLGVFVAAIESWSGEVTTLRDFFGESSPGRVQS